MKKFIIFCLCLLLVGCTTESNESKVVRSVQDFENASVSNGLNVVDNINSYMGVNYISDAKLASLNNLSLEMVVYTDTDSAVKVQNEQIDSFKTIKNTATTENKEKGTNYYKFWMVSNGYYMINVRVENTLIFCKTPLNNKEKVESILENLGY